MKELGLVGLRARAAEIDQTAVSRHIQGTSDLKLSYLKRALQEPCNQDNEQLLLAYMKAYCDQPDLDLSKEWQQILDAHPALTGLWIAYVDWKQTEAGTMNVLEMVEVYEDLIDRLVRRSENPNAPVKGHDHFIFPSHSTNLSYLFFFWATCRACPLRTKYRLLVSPMLYHAQTGRSVYHNFFVLLLRFALSSSQQFHDDAN